MAKNSASKTDKTASGDEGSLLSTGQIFIVTALSTIAYYFSNPRPQNHYDYTYRVAGKLLRGGVGFVEKQPSWLNEFVPFEGFYYSVFPLGAVLSMAPVALLNVLGLIGDMPAGWIAATLGGAACFFLLKIASKYDVSPTRQIMQTLGILFGTFMWTNLTFAGAWQLALGFAMVGELGAIYFTVYDRRPLLAGLFFAIGFGNRTEILLTAPIFLFLLLRSRKNDNPKFHGFGPTQALAGFAARISNLRSQIPAIAKFCAVPFVLGVATLAYNYVRFHSLTDFGYARIPGVLNEPWYRYGIFSVYYIPQQIWEMLFKLWEFRTHFPLPVPNAFSASILISSPFLLLAFRLGSRDKILKYVSWLAVLILCTILWMHGNAGGWQFAYRYAMVILPWLFVIMLESAPKRFSPLEWVLYSFSFIANAYATWLFNWTENIKV